MLISLVFYRILGENFYKGRKYAANKNVKLPLVDNDP